MGKSGWQKWLGAGAVAAILAGGGVIAWQQLKPSGLPAGFAIGNGRIEATEIDMATKSAGRIKEILVNDGDFIEAGQVVARMDTQTLEAELRQAQAQVRQAQQAKATAAAQVKTGLPGVATVRLDPTAEWPMHLQVRLPQ
jgi:HlyD family secretion protein